MGTDYRTITLSDRTPHYGGATCEVKYLSVKDMLVLQQVPERQVAYLKTQADDPEFLDEVVHFQSQYINILLNIVKGSRNYCGFGDVADGANALEAWIAAQHLSADGLPTWWTEVFAAVRDANVLLEDEAKN